jgi:catechol 2,3-dioxygenase-like lactoylglutathione lyase family enzyme
MGLGWQRAWVTLAARDFGRSVQFYQQFLEQAPMSVIPDIYAEFELKGLRLGIYRPRSEERTNPVEASVEPFGPDPSRPHIQTGQALDRATNPQAFPPISLCVEVADLAIAIAHFTQLGYPPPGAIIVAPHGREIFAYDPDGNRVILYQRSPNPA